MERRSLDISWRSLWRILFFLAFAALMFFSLRILLGLFLAVVISSGLEFIVNFLEKRGLPRTLGVVLVFLAAAVTAIIIVSTLLPLLILDINTALNALREFAERSQWGPVIGTQATEAVNSLVSSFSGRIFSSGATPLTAVSNVFGGLALAISVIISSFYLSLSRDGVERFIRAVLPADYEETTLAVYERSRRRIGLWFRSQIILSLTVGFVAALVLFLLGVKYPILLGVVAGVFELVPFVGPILAGSAAVIAALVTSPLLALYTLIAFVAIQQIENHVLVPLIIGRSVGMHPVIVIVALLIGMQVGGLLGVLAAVPAAVVLQEVVENWAGKKRMVPVPLP